MKPGSAIINTASLNADMPNPTLLAYATTKGQPAELATAYVMLADPLSSYTSGTTVAVTGGKPFI
jgi:NAD(P)-dependent dehydrogenase (short-subunit alcohol dehydrogenase family)